MKAGASVPVRMCSVCRKRFPKHELFRYVCITGEKIFDPKQILPGRGIYVCRDARCGERFKTVRPKRTKR